MGGGVLVAVCYAAEEPAAARLVLARSGARFALATARASRLTPSGLIR
jgi:hypothetical protein